MFSLTKMIMKGLSDFGATFLATWGVTYVYEDGNLVVSISAATLSAVWTMLKNWLKNRQ